MGGGWVGADADGAIRTSAIFIWGAKIVEEGQSIKRDLSRVLVRQVVRKPMNAPLISCMTCLQIESIGMFKQASLIRRRISCRIHFT